MKIPCPTCGHLNPIDKEVIFESVFDWFICGNCDDVYVKSRYGEWLESNPYQGIYSNFNIEIKWVI